MWLLKTLPFLKGLRNINTKIFYSAKVMSPNPFNKSNLVWMDMEMTGLDVDKDQILEVACIITDSHLNIIAEGPDIIIHQDDSILNSMNEWCIRHHGQTGLTEASRKSKFDIKTAEDTLLEFIKKYAPEKKCPLAGNSVYMDRLFLMKYMPKINNYLHYRIVDVSTIKELCNRWYHKEQQNMPSKRLLHRATSDIKESIKELQYYQNNIFRQCS